MQRAEPGAGPSQPGTGGLVARRRAAALAAAVALSGLAAALYPVPPLPFRHLAPGAGPAPRFSLLAVGDTGERQWLPALRSGQLAVARALVEEDLRQPADLLLFLGDNFYPSGLEREELEARVGENLVRPYCRFADLSGPRSAQVAPACGLPASLRRPIPMLAILGNHDHKAPESPELERSEIPRFLPNWHLAASPVEVVEPHAGISLILVDTPAIADESAAQAVRDALTRAAGPWRILVVHEPFAAPAAPVPWPSSQLLRQALAGLPVPVQLVITGHNHALQIADSRDPFPALHVMAGAGSDDREIEYRYPEERLALSRTGFARVDWESAPGPGSGREASPSAGAALEVTVFQVSRYPVIFFLGPRPVARWRVSLEGRAQELPTSPTSPAGPIPGPLAGNGAAGKAF